MSPLVAPILAMLRERAWRRRYLQRLGKRPRLAEPPDYSAEELDTLERPAILNRREVRP